MAMIGVKKAKYLGNQMFQYAFVWARAREAGVPFFIASLRGMSLLHRYFELPSYSLWKNICRYLWYRLSFVFYFPSYKERPCLSFFRQQWRSRRRCLYKGYFQSETYFLPFAFEIRREFLIRPCYRFSLSYYLWARHHNEIDIYKKKIIFHIHKGDATFKRPNTLLPPTYYAQCLAKISHLSDYQLYIIADDWTRVEKEFTQFDYIPIKTTNIIEDFQALQQADILVLSNSSFAWWAAYLHTRAERIFAPQYWLGFKQAEEYPKNVLCSFWEAVPVL